MMVTPCRLKRALVLITGFMCLTLGYAVLVYLKEAIARDTTGGIWGAMRDGPYKLEINPGYSMGPKHRDGQACVHPVLELWHPDLKKYFKDIGRLHCADDENWVYVHNGTLRISENTVKKHGNINCEYTPQLRGNNDFAVVNGKTMKNIADGTAIQSDFFMVRCKATDGKTYKNLHSGIHYRPEFHDRHNIFKLGDSAMGVNVLMFGFDSVSRMTWMRNLPKSHRFFTQHLQGMVLEGYNIVGDGTPQALLPILTGKTEAELPEARRGHEGAEGVDNHPWIWKNFRKQGYVTQWGEDGAKLGTFTYRMLGFTYQPVDHYMRPFYIRAEKQYSFHEPYCLGSLPRHVNMLNYIRQMYEMYPGSPKFSFLFHSELSHDGYSELQAADEDLYKFLSDMEQRGYFNNTILILMSDHGARFHKVRQTVQGKYEERMPYFGFRFPAWFQHKYPQAFNNFKTNTKRLTTPFDIHQTFLDILDYSRSGDGGSTKGSLDNRGISLFKEIPSSRTCAQAGIEMHWCACLNWKDVDKSSGHVISAANHLVSTLNKMTSQQRHKCVELNLDVIKQAEVFEPHASLLKFRKSSDSDGRRGDFSDNMQASEIFYQLTITTTPNNGEYEATLKFVPKKQTFVANEKEISRINMYGNQPHCVQKQLPHLRPYCYCSTQPKS